MSSQPSENVYGNFAPPQTVGVTLFDSSTWKLTTPFMTHKARVVELSLLKLLRSSLKNDFPLAETVNAFADENRWLTKHRIRRFALQLYHGYPLIDCIVRSPYLFSPDTVQAIQLGHQSEEIERTFSKLIEQKSTELNTVSRRFHVTYITWGLMLLILTFFNYFIWPTLTMMVREFYATPPKSMQLAEWIFGHSIGSSWFYIALQIALVISFAYWLRDIPSFRKRTSSFLGWPGLNQLRDRATTLRFIAEALRQGDSLPKLLESLATISNNRVVRKRLGAASQKISQGTSPWTALVQAGWIASKEQKYLQKRDDGSKNSRAAQAILFESKANVALSDIEARINRRLVMAQTGIALLFGAAALLASYGLFDVLYSIVNDVSYND